jgi:hypothetical protein
MSQLRHAHNSRAVQKNETHPINKLYLVMFPLKRLVAVKDCECLLMLHAPYMYLCNSEKSLCETG